MDLQAFRQKHPHWAIFLGISEAQVQRRWRNRARWLLSLSSLGMFGSTLLGLTEAIVVSGIGTGGRLHHVLFAGIQLDLAQVPPHWAVLTVLVTWALMFFCFLALRRLATALHAGPLLSTRVAARFEWLGHWLLINVLAGWTISPILLVATRRFSVTFSTGLLASFIAILLCYTVAGMVREGARAVEENRAFV